MLSVMLFGMVQPMSSPMSGENSIAFNGVLYNGQQAFYGSMPVIYEGL